MNKLPLRVQSVETRIQQLCESNNPTLSAICTHLLSSGGKRVRARLMLLVGELLKLPSQTLIEYAAIIELIHMATLMHDDVLDEAAMRRHQPSTNQLWGNRLSILAGDFLITSGFLALNQLKNFETQAILGQVTQAMIQAEVNQQLACGNFDLTIDQYLNIIHGKTAHLFKAIGEIANHLAGQPSTGLPTTLTNLGMAFQIIDDMIDYASDTNTLGKEAARDLYENKMTLPLVLALEVASSAQRKALQNALHSAQTDETALLASHRTVMTIFHDLKIEKKVRIIASEYCSRARVGFAQFPQSNAQLQLLEIIQALSQRQS